jgi:micrococcal nuclease
LRSSALAAGPTMRRIAAFGFARRGYRRGARRSAIAALVVLAASCLALCGRLTPAPLRDSSKGPAAELLAEGEYAVERAVDGDTLLLENGVRVRLLGVDTPETVAEGRPVERWGPEASAFTRDQLAAAGMKARLAFDRERVDDYGRSLAYVYLNGRLLNEELLRQGLAEPKLQYPYAQAMKDRFRRAAGEAKRAQRGLWSDR